MKNKICFVLLNLFSLFVFAQKNIDYSKLEPVRYVTIKEEDCGFLYPDDIVTEENMRSITEEIVREKILINTSDEIPHSVAVKVEEYKECDDIDKIQATIFCETKSQKGILIGKSGNLLKTIGTQARIDIEKIVEKKVFLGLQVKVEKDWRKKDKILKSFGYVQEN